MRALFLALALLFAIPVQTSEAIVGGIVVPDGSNLLNSIVLVSTKTITGSASCSGTLVDANHVLTAAHCFEEKPREGGIVANTVVQFFLSADKVRTTLPVKAVRIHPLYTNIEKSWWEFWREDPENYDLAVITLDGALPPNAVPMRILPYPDTIHKGQRILNAGYGLQTDGGRIDRRDPTLKVAQQRVSDVNNSPQIEFKPMGLGSVYSGDSGGPAFVMDQNHEPLLWGVNILAEVYGKKPRQVVDGGIAVSLAQHMHWLVSMVQRDQLPLKTVRR